GAAHNELRRRRSPDRGVFAWLSIPRSVLFPHEPTWLMLKPIERPREDRPALVPDDLLVVKEADAQKPVENLAGELRSVPDVRPLERGNQLKRFRPVRPSITADGGFVVALRAVLHVAGLSGPATIQASAVTPLGVEFDAVWRIGDHQTGL